MGEDWVGNVQVEYTLSNEARDMTPTYVSNNNDYSFINDDIVQPDEGRSLAFWISVGIITTLVLVVITSVLWVIFK